MATLIVKATEKCNSNCYYCDVVWKEGAGENMSLEVLETIFRRIGEYLDGDPAETVQVIWHGGEPLLLGPDFYRAAAELQERHCNGTKGRISHSMQTNLTCFREEFVEVLRALGIGSIGTSYDPLPGLRGPGKEPDSDAYNRKFMRGLELLEKHGIGWGMIYVVTKRSLADPMKIFNFLTNFVLSGSISFNPVLIYDDERRDVAITPKEHADFLGAIFPAWWEHRQRFPGVQPFKMLVETIIEKKRGLMCGDSGACTYSHVNVAPDGETSQCGRSADWGLLPYGNLADRPLADIIRDPRRDVLDERVGTLRDGECSRCRFWEICHGGCPLDSWSKHKSFGHKSEWCEAKRGFITRYFEPITGTSYFPDHGQTG